MKIPACLLLLSFAFAMGSCSSENETLIQYETPEKIDEVGKGSNEVGAWTISKDDTRVRLDACNPQFEGDVNSTHLTVVWFEPINAPRPPFYRLEISEDGNFSVGYRSFKDLNATTKQITGLKENQAYFARLQAYLVDQDGTDDNATNPGTVISFAPSDPEVITINTSTNVLSKPRNLEIVVNFGKFSAKWDPPVNASGKLEYVATLYTDELLKDAIGQQNRKTNGIKEWVVKPEYDYWLSVIAVPDPDSANSIDSDSESLVKQFHVPGNLLDAPENLEVVKQGDLLRLSWDPINNSTQNFEYLLMVYLDEEKTEGFGEYHLNVPTETITGVNQNPGYWFDLQAVPVTGNHADMESEVVSLFFEMPVITYATPKINEFNLEPIDDPDEPAAIIKLTWAGSVNGDGQHKYRIEIADDEEFESGFQDYEENANSVGGEYGPLDPGKTYYLRMRTVGPIDDKTRNNSEWSEIKTFVTPGVALPDPTPPEE